MKEQNFKHHTRYVPLWHYVTAPAILSLLIGSFYNLKDATDSNLYSASLICLIAVILVFVFWYVRAFALKAQDRAIRAEEQFRHFILTGKPLPKELRLRQIIALRFASDEEFPALAEKAAREKMGNKEIKASIQQWRPDYSRV
ncbi:MAG: hypothetical protein RLZZ429_1016 [Bacteroidota bacterium]|jgi:hypothetical protein